MRRVLVGFITFWPMAALLAGLAAFMAPSVMGGGAARQARLERVEAVAAWAEMLRDTMAGSGGLEQSIIATAAVAPLAIRRDVVRLAARLERERLAPALRELRRRHRPAVGRPRRGRPHPGGGQEPQAAG